MCFWWSKIISSKQFNIFTNKNTTDFVHSIEVFLMCFFQLRILFYSMKTKLSKTRINFEYKRENDNCLLRHQFPHCYVAAKRKRKLFINVFMKTFTQTDVFFQYIVLLLYMLLGSCLFKELYNILIKARV